MTINWTTHSEWYSRYGAKRLAFWVPLVPREIAMAQVRWERLVMAWRARQTGMTLAQVGGVMFVTRERARQILVRADRLRQKSTEIHGRWTSPIENWSNPSEATDLLLRLRRSSGGEVF